LEKRRGELSWESSSLDLTMPDELTVFMHMMPWLTIPQMAYVLSSTRSRFSIALLLSMSQCE
jgi:hypothetical protein